MAGRHGEVGDAIPAGHGGHGHAEHGGHGGHGNRRGGGEPVGDSGGGPAGPDPDLDGVEVDADGDRATLRLDGRSGGVHRARRLAVRMLAGSRWEPVVDDVRLVLSELTTNALLHGAAPVEVRIHTGGAALRVEVSDASQTMPLRPPAGGDGLTGRGMALVAASATRWGVQPMTAGKIVWAEFAGDGDGADEAVGAGRPVAAAT
ncbi:ATP-binding protein, partial [Frankia gtarii]|uniref:ATP-binding protein n=1 Tax=Frankia gtarii TaxID=2950102 RepID=UPI0021BEEF58